MDDAVRAYVAHYLAGDDVLLMISDREGCREASGRVRAPPPHHGPPAPSIATRPPARRWTKQAFAYSGYRGDDLAYAVTGHSAQGRTVKVGIPVLTGNEDRQWLYVAMTRGSEKNVMIAFTRSARLADPEAGSRPAPEICRHERSEREHAGLPLTPVPVGGSPEPRDAIAVPADILGLKDLRQSTIESSRCRTPITWPCSTRSGTKKPAASKPNGTASSSSPNCLPSTRPTA